MIFRALVVLALLVGPARADVFVSTILETPCSRIYGPRTTVIRSDAELESAWLDLGMRGPAPIVNFEDWVIVVHYAGARPSDGYWLNLSSCEVRDDVLRIDLDEFMPAITPCTFDEPPQTPTFPAVAFIVPAIYRDVQVVTSARF